MGRLAAANHGRKPRSYGAPLLRHPAPRRPPGARFGRRTERVVARPGPGAGGPAKLAQSAGGSARTGRAARRRIGAAAGRLSRGDRPVAFARTELPRGGPAHGAHPGQREKCMGTGPGAIAAFLRRRFMNVTEDGRPAMPVAGDTPKGPALPADDPRLIRALEEYRALLDAGGRPDRREFQARHADISQVLAECLDGLEFIHTAAPQLDQAAAAAEIQPEAPLRDYRLTRAI